MDSKMLFCGEFSTKLDSSNRFVIPSQLLRSLKDDDALVGYIHVKETCIRFYTQKLFDEMVTEVIKNSDKDSQPNIMRFFSMNSKIFDLDIRNRILLPRKFLEKTGIHDNVVIVGLGPRFEVWDADTYDEMISSVDFSDLIAPF
jgi:MraZ protein